MAMSADFANALATKYGILNAAQESQSAYQRGLLTAIPSEIAKTRAQEQLLQAQAAMTGQQTQGLATENTRARDTLEGRTLAENYNNAKVGFEDQVPLRGLEQQGQRSLQLRGLVPLGGSAPTIGGLAGSGAAATPRAGTGASLTEVTAPQPGATFGAPAQPGARPTSSIAANRRSASGAFDPTLTQSGVPIIENTRVRDPYGNPR